MKKIIIYGSKYGSTKKYAEELSKKTKIECISYKKIKKINEYELIICFGAIYASRVMGLSRTLKKIKNDDNKKLIIATVGLSNPKDKDYTDKIKEGIKKKMSVELFNKAKIYHLRGEIDYSKLKKRHKFLLKMLFKSSQKIKEENKTADIKAIIETYNKNVSYIDYEDLNNIIKNIK